jgi:hypothetical protein
MTGACHPRDDLPGDQERAQSADAPCGHEILRACRLNIAIAAKAHSIDNGSVTSQASARARGSSRASASSRSMRRASSATA